VSYSGTGVAVGSGCEPVIGADVAVGDTVCAAGTASADEQLTDIATNIVSSISTVVNLANQTLWELIRFTMLHLPIRYGFSGLMPVCNSSDNHFYRD